MSPFVCLLPGVGGLEDSVRPSSLSGLAAACTVPRKRSIRWRRRGSSVAVFRLGVLRYNHMTVGKKPAKEKKKKTAVVKNPLSKGAVEFTLISRTV